MTKLFVIITLKTGSQHILTTVVYGVKIHLEAGTSLKEKPQVKLNYAFKSASKTNPYL